MDKEQAAQEWVEGNWDGECEEPAVDGFVAGADWREKNPSRYVVDKIVYLSRLITHNSSWQCSVDSIMVELEKGE